MEFGYHPNFSTDDYLKLGFFTEWSVCVLAPLFRPPSLFPPFPFLKVLDHLEREDLLDWDREDTSIVSFATHTTTGEDRLIALRDEVDVMIRVAFVEFLFSPEILGCTETFMVIYRLFTRPVVAIKNTAFIHGYQKSSPATNTEFIQNLIRSQVSKNS